MTVDDIRTRFEAEFGALATRFDLVELQTMFALSRGDLRSDRPGVYVHVQGGAIVRVGRSFSNARLRALQHIADDTGGRMAGLGADPEAALVLFTVEPGRDLHWVAALEVFLEEGLKPLVPSKRRG